MKSQKKVLITISMLIGILLISFLIMSNRSTDNSKININSNNSKAPINDLDTNTNSIDKPVIVDYYSINKPVKSDCNDSLNTDCWQTVISESYGFEFKMPSDWVVLSNSKNLDNYGIVIAKMRDLESHLIKIELLILANDKNLEFNDLCINDDILLESFEFRVMNCFDNRINDYLYKQITLKSNKFNVGNEILEIKTIRDNNIIYFGGSSYDNTEYQETNNNIINGILSSLKLLKLT